MEMPFDVLNHRLGKIRDNGDPDFDNTAAALDIDVELQSKFLFFPFAELDALDEQIEEGNGRYYLGQNAGYVHCGPEDDPDDLQVKAENLLALRQRLLRDRESKAKAAKLAARPAPGIYHLNTKGPSTYIVAVTADRRILNLPAAFSPHPTTSDFTDTFDGLLDKALWTFTLIETGLSA